MVELAYVSRRILVHDVRLASTNWMTKNTIVDHHHHLRDARAHRTTVAPHHLHVHRKKSAVPHHRLAQGETISRHMVSPTIVRMDAMIVPRTMLEVAVDTIRRTRAMIAVLVTLLRTTGLNEGILEGTTGSENVSVDAPNTATSNCIYTSCIRLPSVGLYRGVLDGMWGPKIFRDCSIDSRIGTYTWSSSSGIHTCMMESTRGFSRPTLRLPV